MTSVLHPMAAYPGRLRPGLSTSRTVTSVANRLRDWDGGRPRFRDSRWKSVAIRPGAVLRSTRVGADGSAVPLRPLLKKRAPNPAPEDENPVPRPHHGVHPPHPPPGRGGGDAIGHAHRRHPATVPDDLVLLARATRLGQGGAG